MAANPICETRASYNISEYTPDVLTPVVVLHFITALTTIFLNLCVIITVIKTRSLQTPSRILLCSLSLTDLLLGLIAQPSAAFYYISAFNNWHESFCISWVILTRAGYIFGVVALMNLTVMSIDRCLAVKTLNKYKTIMTKTTTVIVASSLWILGTVSVHVVMKIVPSDRLSVLAGEFGCIMLIIMIISFSLAFYSLKKASTRIFAHNLTNRSIHSINFNIPKYRHSLNTMAMIFALNILVYLPTICFITVQYLIPVPRRHSLVFFQYDGVFLAINSTVNPLFYMWRMKDLRSAVRRLFST